jgi:hypothetical protein
LSIEPEKSIKKLTNYKYIILLSVIGQSDRPLTSYEIFKLVGRSKYVYEMLKELARVPKPFTDRRTNPKYQKRNRESNPEDQKEYERRLNAAMKHPSFVTVTKQKKYSLNFRGFLLYLAGESAVRRGDNRRIRKVVSNPLILKQAPFLQYWQDFEAAEFDVIEVLGYIGKEFQSQLDYSEEYLQRRVTERYFMSVDRYFDLLSRAGSFHIYAKRVRRRTHKKIGEYRLRMYTLLNEWHRDEIGWNNRMMQIHSEDKEN